MYMKIFTLLKRLVVLFIVMLFSTSSMAGTWDDYKARFMQKDGAIIDTGNNNMTHSEGIGYGLMFALFYDDKQSFSKILNWAQKNLYNEDIKLFNWAYKRNQANPTADKNNATDGDLFIAWTLIQAGEKWKNPEYTKLGEKLAISITNSCIIKHGDLKVILPAQNYFVKEWYVILNPSYYIFPAFNTLYKQTFLKVWTEVDRDGKFLLNNLQGISVKLPPDWVALTPSGENAPASGWPTRSSYDAIRVPLYLYWDNPSAKELIVWREYFNSYPKDSTPAWINVVTKEKANYNLTEGLAAVRDLVTGVPVSEPKIKATDDYYNASLKILAYLAYRHEFRD